MERVIKFRAWDKAKNRMMNYVHIIGIEEDFACGFKRKWMHNSMNWNDQEDFIYKPILMQFTGLHDKNGKEIYEGDVLYEHFSTTFSPDKNPTDNLLQKVVKWEKAGFNIDHPNRMDIYEVIGNQFDNPELLTK